MKLLRLVLTVSFLGLACEDQAAKTPGVEYVVACEEGGGASDENYKKFVEAEAASRVVLEDGKAPQLTAPMAGTPLSVTTPPVFTFNPVFTSRLQRIWRTVAGFLVLERKALAHCPAFTGENYLLRVGPAGGGAAYYTATLSIATFTPAADAWQKAMLGHAGETVHLTILRAVFFKGNIMDGPYRAIQPVTFTLAP
jgi:hypothetical protein